MVWILILLDQFYLIFLFPFLTYSSITILFISIVLVIELLFIYFIWLNTSLNILKSISSTKIWHCPSLVYLYALGHFFWIYFTTFYKFLDDKKLNSSLNLNLSLYVISSYYSSIILIAWFFLAYCCFIGICIFKSGK